MRVGTILRRTERRGSPGQRVRPERPRARPRPPRGARRQPCPIALSALELRLLAAFLEADGRVLTRDQLLDAIHGAGEGDVLDRAIDQYVKRLRDKLGDDAAEPRYVATVRGAGYRAAGPVERRAAGPVSRLGRDLRAVLRRGAGRRRRSRWPSSRSASCGSARGLRGPDDGRRRERRPRSARCSTRASRSCSRSLRWSRPRSPWCSPRRSHAGSVARSSGWPTPHPGWRTATSRRECPRRGPPSCGRSRPPTTWQPDASPSRRRSAASSSSTPPTSFGRRSRTSRATWRHCATASSRPTPRPSTRCARRSIG